MPVDNKKHSEVVDQLAALRTASFWDLFFESRLEQEYQHSLGQWYYDTIRSSSLIAAFLLLASHFVEWLAQVPMPIGVLALRGIAILLLLATYSYTRRSRTLSLKHWLVAGNGLLVVVTFLMIAHYSDAPIKQIYYTNIFFVEIVVFGFIRMPINFASTTALLMVLMVASSLYLDVMGFRSSIYLLFLLLCGTALCMMIAYRMERAARETFLQAMMIKLERDQLRELNNRMAEQFSQDRITRLQNRMTFEDTLMQHCGGFSHRTRYLLLGIHIEHFGRFNELLGPDRGDDLLRDIARHLRNVLADVNGTAARISGGRFLVLFPCRDEPGMRTCLEALRSRLLGIALLNIEDVVEQGVELRWGGVNIQPDPERDPRALIDRIFNHLTRMERESITNDHVQAMTRRASF